MLPVTLGKGSQGLEKDSTQGGDNGEEGQAGRKGTEPA